MQHSPIHADIQGEGSPLLLVHGDFSDGNLAWREQRNELAGHHRLVVVDRRGFGQSPHEPKPYTIASDAADLVGVLDAAGIATAHVAGHSYGGLVALELASQWPQRLMSLHLIEPPLLALLPNDPDVSNMVAEARKIYKQATGWTPEEITRAFFSMVTSSEFAASLPNKPIWPRLLASAKRIVHQQFPGEYSQRVLKRLRPDLVVQVYRGGKSHSALRKVAEAVANALPGARLIEIAEAYHDVQRAGEPFHRALLSVTQKAGAPRS